MLFDTLLPPAGQPQHYTHTTSQKTAVNKWQFNIWLADDWLNVTSDYNIDLFF